MDPVSWKPPFCNYVMRWRILPIEPFVNGGIPRSEIDQYNEAVKSIIKSVNAGRDPMAELEGAGLLGIVKKFRIHNGMCLPPACYINYSMPACVKAGKQHYPDRLPFKEAPVSVPAGQETVTPEGVYLDPGATAGGGNVLIWGLVIGAGLLLMWAISG